MIFLMYALTWSSEDMSIVRPYFLTLWVCELSVYLWKREVIRGEVLGGIDASLESAVVSEFANVSREIGSYRIVFMEYWNCGY